VRNLERKSAPELTDRHFVFTEDDVGVCRFESEKHLRIERNGDISGWEIERDLSASEHAAFDELLADSVEIRTDLRVSTQCSVDALVLVLALVGGRKQSVAEIKYGGDNH
jgi:hypothetical protein